MILLNQHRFLKSSKKPITCIVGPMGSGKTRLFLNIISLAQNTDIKVPETVTSFEENVFDSIIDIPGHSKLTANLLNKYSSTAKSISLIVCIDISSLSTGLKTSSRYILNSQVY